MQIRLATEHDLPEVAAIHVASWQAAYRGLLADDLLDGLSVEGRIPAWQSWYADPQATLWVADDASGVAGFCKRVWSEPGEVAEITHLYLQPRCYGRGIGSPLLAAAVEATRSEFPSAVLFLWVLEKNRRARHFYEREGWIDEGTLESRHEWLGEGVFEAHYRYGR